MGRVLAVADAFDAMVSDRSYRMAYSLGKAKQELINRKGTQFDPNIVDVFLKCPKPFYIK